jgi:protein involved in plasmid replication-relaxation
MTDTALPHGHRVQGRCTAEGVGSAFLWCYDSCAGRHVYGENVAWIGMSAGGGDERGAGARGGAPARARPRPQQHAGLPAPVCRRFARPFGWRFVHRDPPPREAAGWPSWWEIRPPVESRHTSVLMRSSPSLARRGRVTGDQMAELASHLTDRDREIAVALYEHRILTSSQLALLFFSGRRRAMDRLLFLYRARVLDRFYPPRPFAYGKPQAHWLLDEAGAHIVAACLGIDRRALGWRQRENWGAHPQLAHHLEVNTFVTDVIAATLPYPGLGVTEWWGSASARDRMPDGVGLVPDAGFLLSTAAAGVIDCVVEWDRGTEPGSVLEHKLRMYGKAAGRSRDRRRVLFVVPGARRAATLAQAAAGVAEREVHHKGVAGVRRDGAGAARVRAARPHLATTRRSSQRAAAVGGAARLRPRTVGSGGRARSSLAKGPAGVLARALTTRHTGA